MLDPDVARRRERKSSRAARRQRLAHHGRGRDARRGGAAAGASRVSGLTLVRIVLSRGVRGPRGFEHVSTEV